MPRAKRGVKARRRRNKILKAAKGFVGGRQRYRQALETVRRAWRYSHRDRRAKKRNFRELWIVRINAAARQCGVSYSKLIDWLNKANVDVDRKVLSDLAVRDFPTFERVVNAVRPS